MQGSAGNAAAARWVAAGRSSRAGLARSAAANRLQRYEAGEHSQFGSSETVMVNGVPISRGNIIAMGDFFRTPEDMMSASPDMLRQLDAAITTDERARKGELGENGEPIVAPTDADLERITKPLGDDSYLNLSKENDEHFAPPTGGESTGEDHKAAFAKHHRAAIEAAIPEPLPGGVAEPAGPSDHAVATNMFAAHFLTDAFSAGHLINKAEIKAKAKASFEGLTTDGRIFKENSFTKKVAAGALADPRVQERLAGMEMLDLHVVGTGAVIGGVVGGIAGAFAGNAPGAILGLLGGAALGGAIATTVAGYGPVTNEKFSEFLHISSSLAPGAFYSLFVKLVHDRLNQEGVEVTNGSATWKLSGDTTLNEESLAQGREAVKQAEANLVEAAAGGPSPPIDEMIERVWQHVPHPTDDGQAFIDTTVTQFTDAGDAGTVAAIVELTAKQIELAIEEMTKLHVLRPKEGAAK